MSNRFNSLTKMSENLKENYIDLENSINSNVKKTIYLNNQNFKNGTVIIAPDYYLITDNNNTSIKVVGSTKNTQFTLTEDIVFNPNSLLMIAGDINDPSAREIASSSRPSATQVEIYPQDAYGLGFFCAISIYSNNIILNLNGFEIKQSSEHALQQRFYSNIELASIPFLPSQGPHTFGTKIKFANKCIIKNGILGRSSHHAIHGNLATNIIIKNIIAYDYEVGIIGLNGVRNIFIDNLQGEGQRTDVPVLGIFSTARFIWPFLDALQTYNSETKLEFPYSVNGNTATLELRIEGIITAIENDIKEVYLDVIDPNTGKKTGNLVSNTLYKNTLQLVDGNSYAILINQVGVAVLGFPISSQEPSSNIYIVDSIIKNHIGFINEIPALENPAGGHEKDPVGSVFQTQNKHGEELLTITSEGIYKGNAVANAQLYIAKAIINDEKFFMGKNASDTPCVKRNSISQRTLNWAESGQSLNNTDINYIFNGDSMFHVNKGLVTFKLDAIDGLYVNNCVLTTLHNKTLVYPHGKTSLVSWDPATNANLSSVQKKNYILYSNGLGKSHLSATYNGSGAHNIRAWSLSSSRNCLIKNCVTRNVKSELGKAIGYDVHQDSDNIYIKNCSGYNIDGGVNVITDDDLINIALHRSMKLPKCIGFRAGPKTNTIIFDDCTTDGSNRSPIHSGAISIEILSNTGINIKTL